jgi:hypothetical protein
MLNKKTLFYIEQSCGCGLKAAFSLEEATKEARREIGTDNFIRCSIATQEQIEWVRSMGGRVPSLED